jgi:hypothetical protein
MYTSQQCTQASNVHKPAMYTSQQCMLVDVLIFFAGCSHLAGVMLAMCV